MPSITPGSLPVIWLPRGSALQGGPRQRTKRAIHRSDRVCSRRPRGWGGGGTETLYQNTTADNRTQNTPLSVATERSPQLRRWCVQGSNLCRCSGEFRTGTPPHPS
ncbi:hypothetical protein EYF80_035457 [Liparis tanakae]|uniref:Uncharacterized protein n=1 Tax=Liparis tanakae TaxID=230148 RepID=A0A4Z2GL98_9TELE|nr:hypothetical protein EYF80_035457 [Liparis tanakae]